MDKRCKSCGEIVPDLQLNAVGACMDCVLAQPNPMTTPNEREARELLAQFDTADARADLLIVSKTAAIRAIIAALTREQREGDGIEGWQRALVDSVHRWREQPQQEAPGAVAWACMDGERMMRVSHSREEMQLQAHGRGWTVEPLGLLNATTPPAPVDVRGLRAALEKVRGIILRPPMDERAQHASDYERDGRDLQKLLPEINTLLDGQQAGVDAELIRDAHRYRYLRPFTVWWQTPNVGGYWGDELDAAVDAAIARDPARADALQAALGGGGGR